VDAIAVGHYVGVAPQYAELALDQEISRAPGSVSSSRSANDKPAKNELLITALHRRGTVKGELAQNFFVPDPRDPKRLIVIAGMGQPGTFHEAELAVLARELIWSLGQCNRSHLCRSHIRDRMLKRRKTRRIWLRTRHPEGGIREMHRSLEAGLGSGRAPEPIRLTIRLLSNTFEFAALTARFRLALQQWQSSYGARTQSPRPCSAICLFKCLRVRNHPGSCRRAKRSPRPRFRRSLLWARSSELRMHSVANRRSGGV
jgi:hypothetical protein